MNPLINRLFTPLPAISRMLVLSVSVCLFAMAFLVLLSWHFGRASDLVIPAGSHPMSYLGALGFSFGSLGLMALLGSWRRVGACMGALLIAVAVFSLLRNVMPTNPASPLFLKLLFAHRYVRAPPFSIPRSVGFFTAGFAIMLLSRRSARIQASVVPGFFGLLVFLLGLLLTVGFGVMHRSHLQGLSFQGSISFLFLGLGIVGYAWQDKDAASILNSIWFPVTFAMSLAMVACALWRGLIAEDQRNLSFQVGSELNETVREIERRMEIRIEAMEHFAKHWARWGRPARKEWESDAFDLVSGHQGYQSMAWVDEHYRLRWIVPLAGNEPAINLDARTEPRGLLALERAYQQRSLAVTGPLSLGEGSKGFKACVPLFHENRFEGFLVSSFNYKALFDQILHSEIAKDYFVSVSDQGEWVYRREATEEAADTEEWAQTSSLKVAGELWNIRVSPTPAKIKEESSLLPRAVALTGSLLVVLVYLVCYLVQTAWQKTHAAQTARKLASELNERAQNERKLLGLLEAAPDGVLVLNAQQKILSVNSQAERLFGFPRHELLGQALSFLLPSTQEREVRLRRKDGSDFPAQIKRSEFNTDAEALGIVSIRDITDLEEKQHELQRSNRELEQFAYVASHDLQEPLRMIISYLGLISRRYQNKLDREGEEFITFAVEGARRMKFLIEDILTLSRVSRDTRVPKEWVSMDKLMSQVKSNLAIRIEETRAEIVYDSLPEVFGYRVLLLQLIQNLVGNALKYWNEVQARVEIKAERGNREWIFSVKDNGIGFDMVYAERIFIVFQRLHGRDKYSGTGVGLAICKKIVERHGGRIWAEATVEKGATFFFSLPFTSNPTPNS